MCPTWETMLCKLPAHRYAISLPSLKHEEDLKDDGWGLLDVLSRPSENPWLPHLVLPPVMKDWGGVADNQITEDYVSHLTCADLVTPSTSGFQSSEAKENRNRQIKYLSPAHFFLFSVHFYLSYTRSFCIFFSFFSCDSLPSCGKGLLMNVDVHVGNVWVSTTAFSLSDRSSTRLWRLA